MGLQIGFVSSVLFGLLSMEVAEGPPAPGDAPFVLATFHGPVAWRDVAASLLVLAALMCSMVGVTAGVALGVLLLGRFGWQRALQALHAMPAAVFLTWFALTGHSGLNLAGQYESWILPLAVILCVPMALLGTVAALTTLGAISVAASQSGVAANNLYTQIGLILLIALGAKNAILIVEYARQQRAGGKGLVEAAVEGARLSSGPSS